MTTRFKASIVAGVAAMTLAVAVPAFVAAQDQPSNRRPGIGGPGGGPGMMGPRRGPGGPMGFGPGFRALDLTDAQKDQLRQIADSHREEFKAAGEKARVAHDGMRALMEADQIDENAIRAKSQEIAAAEAEVMILNARVRQQSMQILTAEQIAKLKALRDQGPGPGRRGPGGPRQRRPQQQKQQL